MTAKPTAKAARNASATKHARGQPSSPARAAQPARRGRRKPGATGAGDYYHIEVRPRAQFTTFRTQDVGRRGGIERVAGKRSTGSWDTQKWLIAKDHAHIEHGRLIADSSDAREVLQELGSAPEHIGGDRFKAAPRPDVPEREKPTPHQRTAQQRTIKKAQAARRVASRSP
jgi:hypothetical protein